MTKKFEYRKVTPEEKLHVTRLQSIVFSSDNENEQTILEQIAKGEYKSDNTYGAVDADGRVAAGMEILPYTMWFDGHKVPMYGIGGVASMPETRRQGHIRKIFEKVFDDIYGLGAVFSHLYPFSYDYYRKFGYEHAGSVMRYTLPLEQARRLKNSGSAHEFIKSGGERERLIEVYESYASRHNMMLSRTEKRWDEVFNIGLFGADRLYYWKCETGEIKSWIKFKKDGDTMKIHDIAWVDHEGMLGIFQFMGMFDGAADNLKFASSPEFIPDLYWNDIYDIEAERAMMGMNRVVDAKRALELIKKEGEGGFKIKVTDDFASWNNNTYAVEYGAGECTVKTTKTGADIEVSARALVQLVLGVFELEYLKHRDDVQINSKLHTLECVFRRKKMLLADHF
ncbi:MAG: GNAT family N-acetyltransferase [Oscillospiraceae bacterium]|nr:GNAT family N-acetyltransferase [Oscillospiraceae bacterium]